MNTPRVGIFDGLARLATHYLGPEACSALTVAPITLPLDVGEIAEPPLLAGESDPLVIGAESSSLPTIRWPIHPSYLPNPVGRDEWERVYRNQVQAAARRMNYWLQPGVIAPADLVDGPLWYRRAHATAAQLAVAFDLPIETVITVISAISPLNRWESNLQGAQLLLFQVVRGAPNPWEPLQPGGDRPSYGTVPQFVEEAFMLARGIGPALTGNKRRSFYINILDPLDVYPVTVDAWIWRAALGIRSREDVKLPGVPDQPDSNWRYAVCSDAVRYLASRGRLSVNNQMQAILWLSIRRSLE